MQGRGQRQVSAAASAALVIRQGECVHGRDGVDGLTWLGSQNMSLQPHRSLHAAVKRIFICFAFPDAGRRRTPNSVELAGARKPRPLSVLECVCVSRSAQYLYSLPGAHTSTLLFHALEPVSRGDLLFRRSVSRL
ncbi:hypothetical protein P154DRAFT_365598 [Amniculicola lignicola CBS 123094]|uniref:Uncharacterized protein n=1 Tax=Amniculicola lignicola CBS 123094 TaxID=1392246 RepID=A0A6A5W0U3_9PLEO|nr:hypothetical protein P154DRAFT_365598 [Amniculicola lignicola CBS 123094]